MENGHGMHKRILCVHDWMAAEMYVVTILTRIEGTMIKIGAQTRSSAESIFLPWVVEGRFATLKGRQCIWNLARPCRGRRRGYSTLRPYQEECISVCLNEFQKGVWRQAVSLPVGSGKTVIFANLINKIPEPRQGANKVLVLAHRVELLEQACRQIRRFAPHLRVALEMGRINCDFQSADVIVASVPTLGRSGSSRLNRLDPTQFKAIIIDEAHHSVADSYLRILRHFKIADNLQRKVNADDDKGIRNKEEYNKIDDEDNGRPDGSPMKMDNDDDKTNNDNKILLWGCSATFNRQDELALGSLFEKIVYHLDLGTMMRQGWLCPVEVREIFTSVDLEKVKMTQQHDFDHRGLSLAIDTPCRNELVAMTWYQLAHLEHQRKSTIVFALNVAHAKNLSRAFASLGIRSEMISAETNEVSRRQILNEFANGRIPVLVNCAVLTEGTDLPITDCIVLTRPTCNSSLYTQMVGRGLRQHPDKKHCLLLDFVDKYRSKMRSLITFPSLFPNITSCSSSGPGESVNSGSRTTPSHGEIDMENVDIKIRIKSRLEYLKNANPGFGLAWIYLEEDHFALCSPTHSFLLQLHPQAGSGPASTQDQMTARLFKINKGQRGRGETYVLEAMFGETPRAVHELVPLLREELEMMNVIKSFQSSSYWRGIRPMTTQQRVYLFTRILCTIPNLDLKMAETAHSWSVGRVSDIISKYILRTRLLNKPVNDLDDLLYGIDHYFRGPRRSIKKVAEEDGGEDAEEQTAQ